MSENIFDSFSQLQTQSHQTLLANVLQKFKTLFPEVATIDYGVDESEHGVMDSLFLKAINGVDVQKIKLYTPKKLFPGDEGKGVLVELEMKEERLTQVLKFLRWFPFTAVVATVYCKEDRQEIKINLDDI